MMVAVTAICCWESKSLSICLTGGVVIVIPFWRHLLDKLSRNFLSRDAAFLFSTTTGAFFVDMSVSIGVIVDCILHHIVGVERRVDELLVRDPSVGIGVGDLQNGADLGFR